jgi:hypothetical protein
MEMILGDLPGRPRASCSFEEMAQEVAKPPGVRELHQNLAICGALGAAASSSGASGIGLYRLK